MRWNVAACIYSRMMTAVVSSCRDGEIKRTWAGVIGRRRVARMLDGDGRVRDDFADIVERVGREESATTRSMSDMKGFCQSDNERRILTSCSAGLLLLVSLHTWSETSNFLGDSEKRVARCTLKQTPCHGASPLG